MSADYLAVSDSIQSADISYTFMGSSFRGPVTIINLIVSDVL